MQLVLVRQLCCMQCPGSRSHGRGFWVWLLVSSGYSGDMDVCSYVAHFCLASLDMEPLLDYREHSFRFSPLVPDLVRLPLGSSPNVCTPPACVQLSLFHAASLASCVSMVKDQGSVSVVHITSVASSVVNERLDAMGSGATFEALESALDRGLQRCSPRQYNI